MEFLIGFSETNIDSNQQNTHITTDTHRRGNHQPHRLPPPREAPSHHQTIPPSGHPSITKPRPKADRSQNHETPNGFAETSRHQRPPMLAHALRAATTTSPKHDTGQIRLAHKRHTRTKPRPPGQQTTQSQQAIPPKPETHNTRRSSIPPHHHRTPEPRPSTTKNPTIPPSTESTP